MKARARRAAATALLTLSCAFLRSGQAQIARPSASAKASASKPISLLSQLGAPASERLLASDSSADRLRALARLSALGTPRAIELLARALDPGGAARGADEHLAAVRALAPHAKAPLVREALVRALSSPPVQLDAGPLSEWVQSAAALALAQSADPAALAALGRALRKPGHAAELTRDALLANPPADLGPLLHVAGTPSKELCQTLGELGDLRAESFLRDVVRRGVPEARAAAALALQKLGSTEVLPLARHWLATERQPLLLAAAAEIALRAGSSQAAAALGRLFEGEATREQALSLLLAAEGRVAAPPSLDLAGAADRAPAVLELWARTGATAPLERALQNDASRGLALYALSRVPGAAAQKRLNAAFSAGPGRARALRALGLRALRFGERSAELDGQLAALRESKEPAERAAAAFVGALLEPNTLAQSLASRNDVIVRAVARLAISGKAAELALGRLQRERDPALRTALSIGLADAQAALSVPTPLLLELTHEAGPSSLLAAMALAARKDADLLPLVRELLGSGDPWLRAHTLLGLGRAESPDALGLIENAYRFEPDATVRHAAVVALSRRPEPVRARGLTLAAQLDASRTVREAARLALSGQVLAGAALGAETAWLELAENPGVAGAGPETAAALVRFAGGLALPVVADPDGVAVLAGVDPALVEVRLALLGQRVNLPARQRP